MRSIPGLGWLIAVIIITAVIASSLVLLPITNGNTRIDTKPSLWIRDDSGISYTDVAGARCFVESTHGYMQCISLKDL